MRNTQNAAESRLRCPEPRSRAIIVQMVYLNLNGDGFFSQELPLTLWTRTLNSWSQTTIQKAKNSAFTGTYVPSSHSFFERFD